MNDVRQFIFPGAIISSLILASFGYTVMARVPSSTNNSSDNQLTSSPAAGEAVQETENSNSDEQDKKKKDTEALGRQIVKLVACKVGGDQPDPSQGARDTFIE